MKLRSFSNRIKRPVAILIVVLIHIWYVLSGVSFYINCLILEQNYDSVMVKVKDGYFDSVVIDEISGNFVVADTMEVKNINSVSNYVRVGKLNKYYYNSEDDILVLSLSNLEIGKIISQFTLLSIVLILTHIVLAIYANRLNNIERSVLKISFFICMVLSLVIGIEASSAITVLYEQPVLLWLTCGLVMFNIAETVFNIFRRGGSEVKGKEAEGIKS